MIRHLLLYACSCLLLSAVGWADDRAYGSGHLDFEEIYGDVQGKRIFTFNVRRDESGKVKGHAYDQTRITEASEGGFEFVIKDHIEVDCLNIVGNTAYMSGVIVKANEEDKAQIGRQVVFSVRDHDREHKKNRLPDEVSFVHLDRRGTPRNPLRCYIPDFRTELRDRITSGNLHVRQDED